MMCIYDTYSIDIPDAGLLCDLLWSDPQKDEFTGKAEAGEVWELNLRGVSYTFGEAVVEKFVDSQNLDLIVRAHQVVEDGYEFFCNRKLVTIFSAPRYCNAFDNVGGVMSVTENLVCSFIILGKHVGDTVQSSSLNRMKIYN